MCGNSFPLETRDFKNVKIVKDPSTGENSYFTYQYVNNGVASGFHYQCGAVVEEYRNCAGECTYYVWNCAFGFSDNNEICCQSYGKTDKETGR